MKKEQPAMSSALLRFLPTIFVLAGLSLFSESTTLDAQSMDVIDSRQIYDDANLIVVFQIERLEKHLSDKTREDLAKTHEWLQELTQLDTASCKEVIMQLGAKEYPDGNKANEAVGFVFRSENEIPQGDIDGLIQMASFDSKLLGEQEYFMGRGEPAFMFQKNSLLIAEEQRVIQTIESSDEERESKIVENISRELDIAAHIDFGNESFKDFFHGMFGFVPSLRDAEYLKSIADNCASVSLQVDLDAMRSVQLTFELNDNGDVEATEAAARKFVAAVQDYIDNLERDLSRGAPSPEMLEHVKGFTSALRDLLSETEFESDATSVTVMSSNGEAGKKSIDQFAAMMNSVAASFAFD